MALRVLSGQELEPDIEDRYFQLVASGFPAHSVQAGAVAVSIGRAEAARSLGYSYAHVHYWMKKFLDPQLHVQRQGGARNWKYGVMTQYLVESVLWKVVRDLPCENPKRYCEVLADLGLVGVKPSWVTRAFKRWRYSRKKVYHVQRRKFTLLNVCRYLDHVMSVPHLDPTKLKYLDESRFETRRVRRSHGYSAVGQRIHSSTGDDHRQSYTVTLVTLTLFIFLVVEHTQTHTHIQYIHIHICIHNCHTHTNTMYIIYYIYYIYV